MALDRPLSLQHIFCPWHFETACEGKASNCPGSQLNQMAEREVQDRNTTDASQLGVLLSTGTAKGTGKMEPRARGRQDGTKNINSSVTYCAWGLKISVCSWQWFYGGFFCCCYSLFFFFNAYITLPQTDNSSQPLCQSSNPADPLLCLLLAWAPWRFLHDSSGGREPRSPLMHVHNPQ